MKKQSREFIGSNMIEVSFGLPNSPIFGIVKFNLKDFKGKSEDEISRLLDVFFNAVKETTQEGIKKRLEEK